MSNKDVTFIINTYPRNRRDKDIKNTLDSIFQQQYKNISVLIIENYKNDSKIKKIVKSDKRIIIICNPIKKLSYLFNLGWKSIDSKYLAYVADDVSLENDWLSNALKDIKKHKRIAVITGPIISTCFPAGEMHRLYLATRKSWIGKLIAYPYLRFSMEGKILSPGNLFQSGAYSLGSSLSDSKKYPRQEIDLATTSSMLIKRDLLEQVKGFDEDFNFNHADGDLFIRIKKAGFKIIFNPKVIAHHNVRLGPSRNPYYIGYDTGIFYRKDIRPKSLSGYIGLVLNVMMLNIYWIYGFIKTRDAKQLTGITGFVRGLFF